MATLRKLIFASGQIYHVLTAVSKDIQFLLVNESTERACTSKQEVLLQMALGRTGADVFHPAGECYRTFFEQNPEDFAD